MDYLNRTIKVITNASQFSFNPLSNKTQLAHLCFADDLLLFYEENANSVTCLDHVHFEHFIGVVNGLERTAEV